MSKIVPYRPPRAPAAGYTPRRTMRGDYLGDAHDRVAGIGDRLRRSPLGHQPARRALAQQIAAEIDSTGLAAILVETIDAVLALEARAYAMEHGAEGASSLEQAFHARRSVAALDRFLDAADDLSVLRAALRDAFSTLLAGVSSVARPNALMVPMISLMPRARQRLTALIRGFWSREAIDRGHFFALRETLERNVCLASGLEPGVEHPHHKLKFPDASNEAPETMAATYLRDTPLLRLLLTPVPLVIPIATRFEHTHIVAGSGHGKTQTLQHLIGSDLREDDPPSLVIVDSQGEMLDRIARLAVFDPVDGRLRDRLVIVDPRDVTHPPALNLFAVTRVRHQSYDVATTEQLMNGVIELFDYIFGALLGADLTQKQGVVFRYLARLMLVIPGATIQTLREVLENPDPFLPYMQQLSGAARGFFEHQFFAKDFTATKTQILRRLWGVLEQPTFERLLSAPENTLDIYDHLQSGKIVLVNTAKDFMKADRSAILGRMFIAMTLQAALERAALPSARRRPAFLIIDEAADYFDTSIDHLLVQARKYKLGVCLAHQHMDQLNGGLRASIAANTSIKLAGGTAWSDARSLAPDLRTTPEFIIEQEKRDAETRFALFVRNLTPQAVSVSVPLGALEAEPVMSEQRFRHLLEVNRQRLARPVAASAAPTGRARPASTQQQSTATDDDTDWRS